MIFNIWESVNEFNIKTEIYIKSEDDLTLFIVSLSYNNNITNSIEIPINTDDIKIISDYFTSQTDRFIKKELIFLGIVTHSQIGRINIILNSTNRNLFVGLHYNNIGINNIDIPISDTDLTQITHNISDVIGKLPITYNDKNSIYHYMIGVISDNVDIIGYRDMWALNKNVLTKCRLPLFRNDYLCIMKYICNDTSMNSRFNNINTSNISTVIDMIGSLKDKFINNSINNIETVCVQRKCAKYDSSVSNDKDELVFKQQPHFIAKASAEYNHLLYKNPNLQNKYNFIKDGDEVMFYYTNNGMFAFPKGAYPYEFAPQININKQFKQYIIQPINSVVNSMRLPSFFNDLHQINEVFSEISI